MTTKTATQDPAPTRKTKGGAGPARRRPASAVAAPNADPPATSPPPSGPRGKIGLVVGLLQRPEGANIAAMMEATGWQAHSVRGAIAGAIKKKLGLKVVSAKTDAGRVYRIEPADDAA